MRLALTILLSSLCTAAAAEPLGRLFYTPQERQALEAQRQAGGIAMDGQTGNQITLDGVVKRPGGKSTIWVNRTPRYEGETMPGKSTVGKDGRALVRLPDSGRSAVLKVGQTLDAASGAVREGYQRGPRNERADNPAAAAIRGPAPPTASANGEPGK